MSLAHRASIAPLAELRLDHADEEREDLYRGGIEALLEQSRAHRWTVIGVKSDRKTVLVGQ